MVVDGRFILGRSGDDCVVVTRVMEFRHRLVHVVHRSILQFFLLAASTWDGWVFVGREVVRVGFKEGREAMWLRVCLFVVMITDGTYTHIFIFIPTLHLSLSFTDATLSISYQS